MDANANTFLTNTQPPIKNINDIPYNILKVPINNVVPNLNTYSSQSTDFNFINNKNVSDLNDSFINSQFMILCNTTNNNTFTSGFTMKQASTSCYLNFYNIKFKLI